MWEQVESAKGKCKFLLNYDKLSGWSRNFDFKTLKNNETAMVSRILSMNYFMVVDLNPKMGIFPRTAAAVAICCPHGGHPHPRYFF